MTKTEREARQKLEELETRQAALLDAETVDNAAVAEVAREIREAKQSLEQAVVKPAETRVHAAAVARHPEQEEREIRRAFNDYLRTGIMESRTQTRLPGSAGGFTVPEFMVRELIKEISDFSAVRQLARVLPPISHGAAVFPVLSDQDAAVYGIQEATEIPTADLEFAQITLQPRKAGALVYISGELLNDSGIDLARLLTEYFGEAIGDVCENAYLNRLVNPTGILEEPGVARVTTAVNNALGLADILNLYTSLPAKYRKGSSFLCNPSLETHLITLVDNAGRPILIDSYGDSPRRKLLGLPIEFSDRFPELAADTDVLALADWRRSVYVCDSSNMSVERNDSVAFTRDAVCFRGLFRTVAGVVLPNAMRVLRMNV